jgi:hypothetical protein
MMTKPNIFVCSSGAPVIRNEIGRSTVVTRESFWDPYEQPKVLRLIRRLHLKLGLPMCRWWLPPTNAIARSDQVVLFDGVLSELILPHLRAMTSAKIIYYFWNPVRPKCPLRKIITIADEVISFDPGDVKRYGLRYAPAFSSSISFANQVNSKEIEKTFDLSFVGRTKGRIDTLQNIFSLCLDKDLELFFHVKGTRQESKKFPLVKIASISHSNYENTLIASRAVLDITAPGQKGITVRGLQALMHGIKVVTDNNEIFNLLDSDISQNIMTIEDFLGSSSEQRQRFLRSEFVGCKNSIKSKYGFDGWLLNIAGSQ